MHKFILYLLRWELSTPILALILYLMSDCNTLVYSLDQHKPEIFENEYELIHWLLEHNYI